MRRRRAVNLGAVRASRARLDAIVREHPELVATNGDGVDGWVTTLERDEAMAEDTDQVAFRLPKSLIKRLDDYAAPLEKEQAGMKVTRTDAVRVLLTRALDDVEPQKSRRPRR
jgi:hypothetical protein